MIGRKIKNYQIEELLGEGGMGVVYRARDLNLNRMVALKMLHPEMLHQPDLLKRFKNEAHVTARLTHPNIATLYNFFSEGDLHCLVMEYVAGKTVDDIIKLHKRIPAEECIRILMQLMEGLEEAHLNEILHRDIKPGNIMINQSGYVKLMDFGVARFENSARITRMNRVIGTLEYMAPELLTGGTPTIQADLYSVGVVAYEMYTGTLPFDAGHDGKLTELILKGTFSYPNQSSGIGFYQHKKLERIITKLMHKKTSKRYLSSKAVLDDLTSCSVSGRVSTKVLGSEPITSDSSEKQPATFSGLTEKAKEAALSIPERATRVVHLTLDFFRKQKPVVLEFTKTSEGKLIGGAIGFAILIVLFANIFSQSNRDDGPPNGTESVQENEPVMNYSGANSTILSNSMLAQQSDSAESDLEENNWQAPPPIVNPSQDSNTHSGDDGNGTPPEPPVKEPNNRSQPEEKRHGSDKTHQNNREQTEEGDSRERTDPAEPEESSASEPVARTISVSVNNQFVEGIFDETISTLTHREGDTFYLITSADVYADGYKVIEAGAKIRGRIQQVKDRGRTRRATLAVTFEEVQAVDGSWLNISYPEYSDQSRGRVTFSKGRKVGRLRIDSGVVNLELQ
ncbi:MAG: protein kinase [Bacteroidetes bacterium]|jgi:serine/threonine-protein kinase|nr:protein kinase [Bacteroidota bacterium]